MPTDADDVPMTQHGNGDERPWSFRRFGADQQATVARDVWDFLQQETNPLLHDICSRQSDFYRAEQQTALAFEQVFPSAGTTNSTAPTSATTSSKDDQAGTTTDAPARTANVLPRTAASRVQKQTQTSAKALLQQFQQELLHTATTTNHSPYVDIRLSRKELSDLVDQLRQFVDGSQKLLSHCQAAITMATHAKELQGRQNEQIREFITTLWEDHSQQLRAYPPFWDLGPLDAPLYGMGRADPPPAGPAEPP